MKKANLLKIALLSVFCLALATVNGQNTLSDEAVKVIKELKQVDTKGLSAEETQTALKVLNQIKPVTVINTDERKEFFFSHIDE